MSAKRGKQVTMAEFKRLWDDLSLSLGDIGERLGITEQAVSLRGRRRGFPPRGWPVEKLRRSIDEALFADMWRAGVSVSDICGHFGIAESTMRHNRDRLGLETRGNCGRFRSISLAEFWDSRTAEAMKAEAATIRRAA